MCKRDAVQKQMTSFIDRKVIFRLLIHLKVVEFRDSKANEVRQHTTALINRINSSRKGSGIVILTAHDAVFTPFCGQRKYDVVRGSLHTECSRNVNVYRVQYRESIYRVECR